MFQDRQERKEKRHFEIEKMKGGRERESLKVASKRTSKWNGKSGSSVLS